MTTLRIFSFDPLSRITTYFVPSADGETFELHSRQDVEAIVDDTKAIFNTKDERAPWRGDMAHVAHIPAIIVADLKRRGIWDDEKALKKWLNDPDNRAFRTRPGRV